MKNNIPRLIHLKKYVSKDQVREAIYNCKLSMIGRSDVIKIVNELEPQDVMPIIHSKWKKVGNDNKMDLFECVECHNSPCIYSNSDKLTHGYYFTPFCPYCGAIIDEIEN